jgi:hypothetical protein
MNPLNDFSSNSSSNVRNSPDHYDATDPSSPYYDPAKVAQAATAHSTANITPIENNPVNNKNANETSIQNATSVQNVDSSNLNHRRQMLRVQQAQETLVQTQQQAIVLAQQQPNTLSQSTPSKN